MQREGPSSGDRDSSRALVTALAVLMIVPAGLVPPGAAEDAQEDRRFIVGLEEVPETIRRGGTFEGLPVVDLDRTLGFVVVEADSIDTVRRGTEDADPTYVEPDRLKYAHLQPNDPQYADQYGPDHVQAPKAWDVTLGSTDAAVCIVDSGLRKSHKEFPSARILGDTDTRNDDGTAEFNSNHGTHVTGIAAGDVHDGQLFAGLGNVGIYVVEAMGERSGYVTDVAQGIRWCADQPGPIVINLSLGSSQDSSTERNAVDYAHDQGALIVSSAGNDGCSGCVGYPAKYKEAIAVSCTNKDRELCSFSSYGSAVDLAAPGKSILSADTDDNWDTTRLSGTSMSSPHVAGVAALAWSLEPGMKASEIRELLEDHATDLGSSGEDNRFGHGLVDAAAVLDQINRFGPLEETARWTFEDGLPAGASTDGLWHLDTDCEDPPTAPTYLGYHREDACSYATGEQTVGSAVFPVDLTDAFQAHLTFDHIWEVEPGGSDGADVMQVDARIQDSDDWDRLARWSPADGNPSAWRSENLSLAPYLGEAIDIRFRFDSKDSLLNDQDGWFVDDVRPLAVTNLLPFADPGPKLTVHDTDGSGDETVELNGSQSTDRDGEIIAYEWFLDGELVASGETAQVTLPHGEHLLDFRVEDDEGGTHTANVTAEVLPNEPPTAFVGDHTGYDDDADGVHVATLDGTGSTDPSGTIIDYTWSLNGEAAGSGPRINVSEDVGTHNVTLTVEDEAGATDTATGTLEILPNQDPIAEFNDRVVGGGNTTVNVTLDGSGSTDPDGSITSYTWFDGTEQIATGPTTVVQLEQGNHTFDLRVHDNGDGTDTATATISVQPNTPPVVRLLDDLVMRDSDGDGAEQGDPEAPLVAWGSVTVADSQWAPIDFGDRFSEPPVVLVAPQTHNGQEKALHPEVRSVTTDSAEIRYCETDLGNDCDDHDAETLAWLALPSGRLPISDAYPGALQALTVPDLENNLIDTVEFPTEFQNDPYVFATTQTANGGQDPSGANVQEVTRTSFRTQHCEHDASYWSVICDDHAAETNGHMAIDPVALAQLPGIDAGELTLTKNQHQRIPFDETFSEPPIAFAQIQTDDTRGAPAVATVTDVTTDDLKIKLCNQGGSDWCHDASGEETVAWFALDPSVLAQTAVDVDGTIVNRTWLLDGEAYGYGSSPPPVPVGNHTLTLRVEDNAGDTGEDTVDVTVLENLVPVADAGDGYVVQDDDGDDIATVELNGIGSLDPDGTIDTYRWSTGGSLIAEGPKALAPLPVGNHTVTLEVTDNGNDTDTDQATVTVLDNKLPEPVATASSPRDGDGTGYEPVDVDASDSFDPDGEIVAYRWFVDGRKRATGVTATLTLPVGTTPVTLEVKDSGNATARTTIDATVLPNMRPDARFDVSCAVLTCKLDGSGSDDRESDTLSYTWRVEGEEKASGPTATHVFPRSGLYTVSLTVTDEGGARDTVERVVRTDQPGSVHPPDAAPRDPALEDPSFDVFAGAAATSETMDVTAAWARSDATNVYVAMEVWNLQAPATLNAPARYKAQFDPGWNVADPSWNGQAPEEGTLTGLQVTAHPRDPETLLATDRVGDLGLSLDLVTRTEDGSTTTTHLQDLEGTIDPISDIIWWMIPRSALQLPAKGGTLENLTVSATAGTDAIADQAGPADPIQVGPGGHETFSGIHHSFDASREGFRKTTDALRGEIVWAPNEGGVLVESKRSDIVDETFERALPTRFSHEDTSFVVSVDWENLQQGHWQRAHPIFLAGDGFRDFSDDGNQINVLYRSRGSGQDKVQYRILYEDLQGTTRLRAEGFTDLDTPVVFHIAYDAPTKRLTGAVLEKDGSLVAMDSYQIGTNPDDGFTFERVGIATDARGTSPETETIGLSDDILVHHAIDPASTLTAAPTGDDPLGLDLGAP